MKRIAPWLIVGGAVAVAVVLGVRGSDARNRGEKKPAAAASTPAPAAPAAEKIAYTFQDDTQLEAFTDQWKKRQAVALRMAVLKGYWDAEQVAAEKLETTLQTQYGFDPAKNYSLDTEKRVLIERKAPEAAAKPVGEAPATSPSAAPAVPPATPAPAGQPAHTFADEKDMKEFAATWQQRQAATLRMSVLQSLWEEQRAELNKMSEALAAAYHLDAAKNYSLDAKRRVLVESVAPAAPADAAAQAQTPAASPAPGAPTGR